MFFGMVWIEVDLGLYIGLGVFGAVMLVLLVVPWARGKNKNKRQQQQQGKEVNGSKMKPEAAERGARQ